MNIEPSNRQTGDKMSVATGAEPLFTPAVEQGFSLVSAGNINGLSIDLDNRDELTYGTWLEFAPIGKIPGDGFGGRKPIKPKFVNGRPNAISSFKRKPCDVEFMSGYWIISDRTKAIFQEMDALAFDFVECELLRAKEDVREVCWLCDIVRKLDAIDYQMSELKLSTTPSLDPARPIINLTGSTSIVLSKNSVKSFKVFRERCNFSFVFFADEVVKALQANNITGLTLRKLDRLR